LLRRFNGLTGAFSWSRFSAKARRKATPAKSRTRWPISLLLVAFIGLSITNQARQTVLNLHGGIDSPQASETIQAEPARAAGAAAQPHMAAGARFSAPLARALALELLLLLLATMCAAFGARELTQADWDMEWLVTLPVKTEALLWGRIIERTLGDVLGIFALWPICSVVAWYSGHGWGAPLVGGVVAFALLPLAAVGHTLIDTGLRLSLSPARLRNVQAIISVVSVLMLLLAFAPGMSASDFGAHFPAFFPEWAMWTPPGLAMRTLNAHGIGEALTPGALLVAQVAIVLVLGVALLRRQLRNGVVASGARESVRGSPAQARAASIERGLRLASPIQWRESMLLLRDRNFLVQTLFMPALIVAPQIVLNVHAGEIPAFLNSAPAIASIAFGIAAYALLFSAMQTLNAEGGALWLLYSFPRSIESVLREKAALWAGLALIYPLVVIGIGAWYTQDSAMHVVGHASMALLGVPIFAVIAVALGVFGSDPLAAEPSKRLRLTFMYLYMALAGIYASAIMIATWWQAVAFVVLTLLLALALWQKARDELPFLLDPAASPPARVSTSDGLIAAMVFFVLQIVIAASVFAVTGALSGYALLLSFAGAGAVTYLLARYVYWRAKTEAVPVVFDGPVGPALRLGVVTGVTAAAAALVYIVVAQQFGLIDDLSTNRPSDRLTLLWFALLAVVAAPVFEEFIFRGLVFGGLRRSFGVVPAAVASAAVFAIVHPPPSILPVFVLGIFAALAYERSRALLAPMTTHALYNAIVVGYQVFGLQVPAAS